MDWLPEVAALTAIASFVLAVVSKAYKYMQKRKASGNSDQAGANNRGLRAGRNVSARFQQNEAGIAFIAGGNVNIQRARNDVTPPITSCGDESRTIAKGFEPPKAIQLITDQIERLKELRPQSLTDVQWQSWRTLTAEILRRADPSRDWSDEFQGVARQAIRQSDTDELYASEVEGFAIQCEKLREKEKAYLESVIGILRLDSD